MLRKGWWTPLYEAGDRDELKEVAANIVNKKEYKAFLAFLQEVSTNTDEEDKPLDEDKAS